MSRRVAGVVAAAVCLGGAVSACADGPAEDRPVVRIAEAAQPSPAIPLGRFLPTAPELAGVLGTGPTGLIGDPVEGDADMLLRSVAEAQASPAECVSAAYRLQSVVYQASPVRSVASVTWAGGGFDGPPVSVFSAVVQMAGSAAAQEFFASVSEQWRRCNGETVAVQIPGNGAGEMSRVTDVAFDERVVSASVLHTSGGSGSPTGLRAIGLAGDCIVEIELTDPRPAGSPRGAVAVAGVILDKIAAVR